MTDDIIIDSLTEEDFELILFLIDDAKFAITDKNVFLHAAQLRDKIDNIMAMLA